MLICKFCSKECKNRNSHVNHERCCANNPNRHIIKKKGTKNSVPSWNKGLTAKTDPRIARNRESFKHSIATGKYVPHKTKHTEKRKKEISEEKKMLYASGWECSAGRCKKYSYNSPIAGDIKVDGKWELIFCNYADFNKLTWKRNKIRFPYVKPDGTESTYQPDFYVEEWSSYVEVKGYETDLDRCKWDQFPEKLVVLRRDEIKEMNKTLDLNLM